MWGLNSNERVEISDTEALKSELWLDGSFDLKELSELLRSTVLIARQDLNTFKLELQETPEGKKFERIRDFIQKKWEILNESRQWYEGVKSSIDETNKDQLWDDVETDIYNANSNTSFDIPQEVQEMIDKNKSTKKLFGMRDKMWGVVEKFSKMWDNLRLAVWIFLWKISPSFAKSLWFENPQEVAKREREERAKKAREVAKKAREEESEILKEKLDREREALKKLWVLDRHKQLWRVYQWFYAASLWLEISWVENSYENKVWAALISQNIFRDLRYNELAPESVAVDKIYNWLDQGLINILVDNDHDIRFLKRHIWLIIKSLRWWDITYKESRFLWIVSKDGSEKIDSWREFLEDLYKTKHNWKTIAEWNPTILELLEDMWELWSWVELFRWNVDLSKMTESMSWWISGIIQWWIDKIKWYDEYKFDSIKDGLPKRLQWISEFKTISGAMIWRNPIHRNLGNNFWVDELKTSDSITNLDWENRQLVESFINEWWDQEKSLIEFSNDIYENIFKKQTLVDGTKEISKSKISLSKAYEMYLATGGETDLDKMSWFTQLKLFTVIIASFSDTSTELGKQLWKITSISSIDADMKNIHMPDKLKNLLKVIIKSVWNVAIKVWKESLNFAWWFWTENPLMAWTILLILWKAPIFSRKTSLSWIFKG